MAIVIGTIKSLYVTSMENAVRPIKETPHNLKVNVSRLFSNILESNGLVLYQQILTTSIKSRDNCKIKGTHLA